MSQAEVNPAKKDENARLAKHPSLVRPLYAFDLPPALHNTLKLRSRIEEAEASQLLAPSNAPSQSLASQDQTQSDDQSQVRNPSHLRVPPCSLCPGCPPFPSVTAQRAHFRSDWHRYNVQLNVQNGSVLVSEQSFERLSEEVESASEVESDEDAQQSRSTVVKTDLVTKILARTSLQAGSSASTAASEDAEADAADALDAFQLRAPLLWFVSKDSAPGTDKLPQTQLGFHRNLFPDPGTSSAPTLSPSSSINDWYAACIASMQAGRITRKGSKQSAWKGKRIKSKEVQEAAKSVMMTVLDGQGFIPGLSTAVKSEGAGSSDEYDEATSGSEYGESSDETMSASTISRNPNPDPPLRMWTVLLLGGGHFAASVIALNPHVTTFQGRKQTGAREDRSLILLAHKAFHRYTTRRKQGGGQAAQDATGRFAKSAGAQLRRYNEAALGDDVRGLLDTPGWRELISRSEKIWIRAGARAARGLLWSWEGAKASRGSPLEVARNDGRLGSLPFPTRRPTIGETVRCFLELTKVKVEHKSEEQLAAEQEEALEQINYKSRKEAEAKRREEKARERAAALDKSRAEKTAKPARLTEEEQAERNKWSRLVEMVRKNRTEALMTFLSKNEEDILDGKMDTRLPDWLLEQEANEAGPSAPASRLMPTTILQLAAEAGSESVTRYLLEEKDANPTLPTERLGELRKRFSAADKTQDEASAEMPHRTAYDLCNTKEVRNVFRRMMAEHPDRYDWGGMSSGGARVPSALTEEMQDHQNAKQKDRRAAMREKARERANKAAEKATFTPAQLEDQVSKAETIEPKSSHQTTNRLGGTNVASRTLLQQRDEQQGLTPEMRVRIEREKRARAAEERIKSLMNN
ncbi:related to VMS1-component of a Cdc48p-complex involved in protein quality control [Ustilago bromivora]|uniref:Related to VMS1 - component of a Cdc48p-complex involved in protein quality control n=1 Tax=Ustilago bromivora TaxID=307758 RepID=A0A1K0GCI5_9BASI|nr:related to VMS1-component of a Cdc48p-complex involved in protein quality control [Ustilago bromivora]SYW76761.1 related to VMS1 - component of a Cdc48p-complex involved in protein quality control [Ustilago bromivora]